MQLDNRPIKRRSTFAVLFYINRTKVRKDGKCQLLCKISIDAASEQIGTKVAVDPALWNPTTGRADGKSRNASEVNRAIDRLTEIIRSHYDRIRSDLGFVTAEAVKNAVKGIGQKPTMLLALFREHNEEFRKRVGIDRTKETHASYENSYNHLAAFVRKEYAAEDIALRSLDATFYDAFDLFLRTDCGLGLKAVHEHLYRLKKMTRRAVGQGTLRCDPYRDLHPELPKRSNGCSQSRSPTPSCSVRATGSSSRPSRGWPMPICDASRPDISNGRRTARCGFAYGGRRPTRNRSCRCWGCRGVSSKNTVRSAPTSGCCPSARAASCNR